LTKQFVCMKWGTRYGPDYVNRLYGMVRRHTTGDIRFLCLTDDASGIREEVACFDCPTIDIPAPYNNLGWRKVNLFAPKVADLTGDVLFIDLDVVITGPLDAFFEHEPDQPFVVMQNPTQPGSRIGNTSVYRFRVGASPDVLDKLLADAPAMIEQYRNSQTFISRTIGQIAFWPEPWCASFKVKCIPPFPQRLWRPPTLPEGARVVIFPGKPDPDEAAAGTWPAPWHKRWYKTLRPTPWIQQHWQA